MPIHPSVAAQRAIKTHRTDYEKMAETILEYAPRRSMLLVFGYAIHYLGDDAQEGALLVAMERVMDKISKEVIDQMPPLGNPTAAGGTTETGGF